MQIANVLVSIGGDHGNTVPLYGVTAAEVAVLLRIHGIEAVTEIEPIGEIERSNREELARLKQMYRAKDEDGVPFIEGIYPGAAARVFQTFADLELPAEHYKARTRATPSGVPAVPVPAPEPAPAPVVAADPADFDDTEADDEPFEDEQPAPPPPPAPVKRTRAKKAETSILD
jgi:hypothetical protein